MPAPPVKAAILRITAFNWCDDRLDHGGQEVRISAMGDSEKDQVFSPNQSENRAWVPMAAGGVFVLVLLVGLVLLTRAGKPANTSAGDPNLAKLQVSGLHMATAENFAGGSVTYIEGKLTNGADRKVTAAGVQVIFKNSLGEIAQKDTLPVTVLLPNVPYVDYGLIDRSPLAPGQTRDFRLTLEHVTTDWDGQVPTVKVVSIAY
jgi:hypothetical protein